MPQPEAPVAPAADLAPIKTLGLRGPITTQKGPQARAMLHEIAEVAGVAPPSLFAVPLLPAYTAWTLTHEDGTARSFAILFSSQTLTAPHAGAAQFILAHEMGHVCIRQKKVLCEPFRRAGLSTQDLRAIADAGSKQEEYAADWFAAQLLGHDAASQHLAYLPQYIRERRNPLRPSSGFDSHPTAHERITNLRLSNASYLHLPAPPPWYQVNSPINPYSFVDAWDVKLLPLALITVAASALFAHIKAKMSRPRAQ